MSEREFITLSLEQDLIIVGLLLNYDLLMEISLQKQNCDYYRLYIMERENYEEIFSELLLLANGRVSVNFADSNLLVTPYTLILNEKTEELYYNKLEPSLINRSMNIMPSSNYVITEKLVNTIYNINNKILNEMTNSKENILLIDKLLNENKLDFDMEHYIDELNLFSYIIETTNHNIKTSPTYASKTFYSSVTATKKNVNYLKDNTNEESMTNLLDEFLHYYEGLLDEFDNVVEPDNINPVINENMHVINEFKKVTMAVINKCLITNDFGNMIPLTLDYFLKEADYVTILLANIKHSQ